MEEDVPKRVSKKTIFLAFLFLAGLAAAGYIYYSKHKTEPNEKTPVQTAAGNPRVQLSLFATGFNSPTAIVSTKLSEDKRLFVLERGGFIRIVDEDGNLKPQPFLDISSLVLDNGEMGLLGVAFSPSFSSDGTFFLNYVDKGQNTIIARYRLSPETDKADPASGQTLLSLKQPYANHNGGDLVFGPDNYLYVALGDGGSAGDPEGRAQNPSSLFGKILRLDVSSIPYKIPPSNPFVNQAGKAGEIWDLGLRNPWRISFDRQTHDLLIADVGQGELEEINFEAAGSTGGLNYGWRCYEGSKSYNLAGCGPRGQYVFPILEYNHSEDRCSVTGGYVYRGTRFPALSGKYFYGDYCNGQLFWAEKKAGQWNSTLAKKTPYKISTFGEDSQGEIYLGDFATGSVYRLQSVN